MTLEEFRKFKFTNGMRFLHQGDVYLLQALDFEEDLVGLLDKSPNIYGIPKWVRCENVEYFDTVDPSLVQKILKVQEYEASQKYANQKKEE